MRNFKTFKMPYIFIDDSKGKYQPIYKEYVKSIPRLNLESGILNCPFLPEKNEKKVKPKISKKNRNKIKYCEICCVKYDNYFKHITTPLHLSFSTDETNYKDIDKFIASMENIVFSHEIIYQSPCKGIDDVYKINYQFTTLNSIIQLSNPSTNCEIISNNDPNILIAELLKRNYDLNKY